MRQRWKQVDEVATLFTEIVVLPRSHSETVRRARVSVSQISIQIVTVHEGRLGRRAKVQKGALAEKKED